jgi:hypothetical protein
MQTNHPTRRTFLTTAAALPFIAMIARAANDPQPLIIDTHQHMWDLDKFNLPWLKTAPPIYRQNYRPQEYQQATGGLNIKSIYMEVDMDPAQRPAEIKYITDLCQSKKSQTIAAVIGARPDSPHFETIIKRLAQTKEIKGVRQVLHGDLPPGACLKEDFIKGLKFLGTQNLSFDLCMRPKELSDAVKVTEQCPDTPQEPSKISLSFVFRIPRQPNFASPSRHSNPHATRNPRQEKNKKYLPIRSSKSALFHVWCAKRDAKAQPRPWIRRPYAQIDRQHPQLNKTQQYLTLFLQSPAQLNTPAPFRAPAQNEPSGKPP